MSPCTQENSVHAHYNMCMHIVSVQNLNALAGPVPMIPHTPQSDLKYPTKEGGMDTETLFFYIYIEALNLKFLRVSSCNFRVSSQKFQV